MTVLGFSLSKNTYVTIDTNDKTITINKQSSFGINEVILNSEETALLVRKLFDYNIGMPK